MRVLRQWPEAVINDEFQLVYLVTDIVEFRLHHVVVGDGLLVLILNLIGLTAGIDQLIHHALDGTGAFGYLLNDFLVAGREFVGGIDGEDNGQVADVLQQREVAQHAGLNLNLLGVGLPFHFVAGLQFFLRHHAETLKHLYAFSVEIAFEDFRARLLYVETSLGGFLHPLIAVAIAVEANRFAGLDVLAQYVDDGVEFGGVASALGEL